MYLFLHYYGLYAVRFSLWIEEKIWRSALFHIVSFFYFPIAWWVTKELPVAVRVSVFLISIVLALFLAMYYFFATKAKHDAGQWEAFLRHPRRGKLPRQRSDRETLRKRGR